MDVFTALASILGGFGFAVPLVGALFSGPALKRPDESHKEFDLRIAERNRLRTLSGAAFSAASLYLYVVHTHEPGGGRFQLDFLKLLAAGIGGTCLGFGFHGVCRSILTRTAHD